VKTGTVGHPQCPECFYLVELPTSAIDLLELAVCPRHGARFDITTGQALTLPAYIAVETFPVRVRDDGMVIVDA